jgi:hypothetical protein
MLLIIILILLLSGGLPFYPMTTNWGYTNAGYNPLYIILVVLLVWFLLGGRG